MVFVQTSPLASLIAIIYTMGRLNYNNELIAMRSGGLSIYKIAYPIFMAGIILSLSIFLISEKIVPKTQKLSDFIKNQYIDKEIRSDEIIKNLAIYGLQNRQFFINVFNTKTNELDGLTILEQDKKQNVTAKIFANKAKWINGFWVAEQYLVYKFDEYNHIIDSQYLENNKLSFEETPEDFLRQNQKIIHMNSKELLGYINKLTSSKAETAIRYLWIDFYQKISSYFTCLIMIFIGLPCAIVIRRKAVGFSSVGISALVALLYYVVLAISIALGKNNIFPALASVLITPAIFVSSSIYLISLTP
jgi:lipopolysaccharide export system permease protein